MDDAISRQAVLKLLATLPPEEAMTKALLIQGVKQMDAAQPEIIRCRECKHYYFADNRIPQEQRYVCDIGGEIWQPDDYCSYAECREVSETDG